MSLPASPSVTLLVRAATRVAPLAAAALVLLGVIYLGRLAHQQLGAGARYRTLFASIECASPPGLERRNFLEEVQYLAELPDELNLLEPGMAQRVAAAFARHPWVEEVERVELTPARQVQVRLRFRTPVLAVRVAGQERLLAVDRCGIRLPASAPTAGLPVFAGKTSPTGPAGTPWGDDGVAAAAHAAAAVRPPPN